MTITKEAYVDIEEKFLKITKLLDEDSKNDPANNPYQSKYNARQLLIGVKANIENLRHSQTVESKEYIKLTAMLALSLLYLARIASDTEETSIAGKHAEKCLETIEKYQQEPEFIIISINILNIQALLNADNEPETAKVCLEKNVTLYKQFKDSGKIPVNLTSLIKMDGSEWDSELSIEDLEKAHTLTLYYLAQIYGTLKDFIKSAVYCHTTLKRQLQYDDYEPIDWSLNAATLSQFFTEKNCFKEARHHLAASSYILQKYGDKLNAETEHNEEYEAKVENYKHRSADVARCWAKYGLALTSTSRDRLLQQADDGDFEICTDFSKLDLTDSNIGHADISKLEFDLNVDTYANQVPDSFLLTYNDARDVFLNIKSWLSKAHSYYTLDTLASDYIEIVQDQSQMYLNLLFFDDNPGNQAKLHKRRADLIEVVLQQINPKFYMSYCRQLWFEVAEIYRDIFHIKIDQLQQTKEHPAPRSLSKINSLLDKSITHYKNFIKSFEDGITKQIPTTIDNNYQKAFLLAYFNIGALCSKFITLDKALVLERTRESFNSYKYIADYYERNPNAMEDVPNELKISCEMAILLPVKIAKLTNELQL